MVEQPAATLPQFAVLPRRGVLGVGGADARDLLQNIVSNDVRRLAPDLALYALLLTPQGKYLHDFFLTEYVDLAAGTTLLLDVERQRMSDLIRRLTLYKLRADVTLVDLSDKYSVAVAFGEGALERMTLPNEPARARVLGTGVAFVDPRVTALGVRAMFPADAMQDALAAAGLAASTEGAYDSLRLRLGIPDSSRDLLIDKTFPLDAGLDTLHAIDYSKGCYVGQELTARTHYRGTIRKRLVPVLIDGPTPEPGTPVLLGDIEAGEMRSAVAGVGLALLRLDHLGTAERGGGVLKAGAATLRAAPPAWFVMPPAEAGQTRT